MKTVALIEFVWIGHHPSYFRLFCSSLLEAGCRVIAFCPQPEEVKRWFVTACKRGLLEVQLLTDEVQNYRWRRKVPQLSNQFRFERCAFRLAAWEKHSGQLIDLAFFACLYNGVAPFVSVDFIFPYPWTGLLLDSGGARLESGPRRWLGYRSLEPLALFRARYCLSVLTLDESIRGEISRRTGGKPVHVLPEVVDDSKPSNNSPLAQAIRVEAAGRRIIGCFGQFARRKGALGFLQLAQACGKEPWFFVWAGSLERSSFTRGEWHWIEAFLAASPKNCRLELTRITEEESFNALVAMSDVLYLRYHQHIGSSNMISKAALFRKPVLVSEGYCMADQVRRYQLGLCVPEDGVEVARAAIHRLIESENKEENSLRWDRYCSDNSVDSFTSVIADKIVACFEQR